MRIGETLSQRIESLPGPARQLQWVDELVDLMIRRVNDPRLRRSPCIKLAQAIVEGDVDQGLLMRALARLDELRSAGELTKPPSAYFNGAVKKLLGKRRSLS